MPKLKKKTKIKKKTVRKPIRKKLPKPKKRKAVKKSVSKKSGAKLSESAILALIEKGRHRGFVTQSEVLNSFPEVEKDIKGLEMLYDRLESSNIKIIESGRAFQ